MPTTFDLRKQKILSQLAIPDQEYTDLSPKGSIDEGIRALVDEINARDGFVTTSSCAGRIAVFLEGSKKSTGDDEAIGGAGGKGGGKWLFISHDPVDLTSLQPTEGALLSMLGMQNAGTQDRVLASLEPSPRLVHFKFEPMILHILTSSLSSAQHALSAGMSAGFRESGIGGITGSDPTPLVAIRTAGLAFDCVVGCQGTSGEIRSFVSEDYLRMLIKIANERFVINTDRTERFRDALSKTHAIGREVEGEAEDWEPADVRRERKRAEGLRKREEVLRTRAEARVQNEQCHTEDGDADGEVLLGIDPT